MQASNPERFTFTNPGFVTISSTEQLCGFDYLSLNDQEKVKGLFEGKPLAKKRRLGESGRKLSFGTLSHSSITSSPPAAAKSAPLLSPSAKISVRLSAAISAESSPMAKPSPLKQETIPLFKVDGNDQERSGQDTFEDSVQNTTVDGSGQGTGNTINDSAQYIAEDSGQALAGDSVGDAGESVQDIVDSIISDALEAHVDRRSHLG